MQPQASKSTMKSNELLIQKVNTVCIKNDMVKRQDQGKEIWRKGMQVVLGKQDDEARELP